MKRKKIIIDGVIFQLSKNQNSRISKVWQKLIREISCSPLAKDVILLDRDNTSPKFNGITRLSINRFDQPYFEADSLYLQDVIDNAGDSIFISTGFTAPEKTSYIVKIDSVSSQISDNIFSQDLWRCKERALNSALGFICESEFIANDFRKTYPNFIDKPIFIVNTFAGDEFKVHSDLEKELFKEVYDIKNPFFLLVGERLGNKNAIQFFRAFSLWDKNKNYEIVCSDSDKYEVEEIFKPFLKNVNISFYNFDDETLSLVYSSATAFVATCSLEGSTLNILEAMKSGCPVLATNIAAHVDVGGDAPYYFPPSNTYELIRALDEVVKIGVADEMRARGMIQAKNFLRESASTQFLSLLRNLSDFNSLILPRASWAIDTGARLIFKLSSDRSTIPLAKELNEFVNLWNDTNSINRLGDIHNNKTQIAILLNERTIRLFENSVTANYCDIFLKFWYSIFLEKLGRLEDALHFLLSLSSRDFNNPVTAIHRAKLATSLGKYHTAYTSYSYLLSLAPRNYEIAEATNELLKLRSSIQIQSKIETIESSQILNSLINKRGKKPTSVNKKQKGVSIVLFSKSHPILLREFLTTIPQACGIIEYEILLYTTNIEYSAISNWSSEIPEITVINESEVFEPTEAYSDSKIRNHGAYRAKYGLLLFASDDISFEKRSVEFGVNQILYPGNSGKKVGAIAFLSKKSNYFSSADSEKYGYNTFNNLAVIEYGLISKEVFLKTKGFDGNYQLYWSDIDLSLQIHALGYKIIVSHLSLVKHKLRVVKRNDNISADIDFNDMLYFKSKWMQNSLIENHTPSDQTRFTLTDDDLSTVVQFIENSYFSDPTLFESSPSAQFPSIPHIEPSTLSLKVIELPTEETNAVHNSQIVVNIIDNKIKPSYLVSAIVLVYNSELFIRGCLDDLISQTLYAKGKLEIVLVDVGTIENEEETIQEYLSQFLHLKYLQPGRKLNTFAAWNIGIKNSSGEFITNADIEGRHKTTALEDLANILQMANSIGVTYADCYKTIVPNDIFTSSSNKERVYWRQFDNDLILFDSTLGTQPMWRRELHSLNGYFDETLTLLGDYDFWLRLGKVTGFYHSDKVLGLYYNNEKISQNKNKLIIEKERLALHKKYFTLYITKQDDINRIKNKLEIVKLIENNEAFFNFAFSLLMKRVTGLQIHQKVQELSFLPEVTLSRKNLLTLEKIISIIKTGEVFLDEKTDLALALNLKANHLLSLNKSGEALAIFKEVISVDSKNPAARKVLSIYNIT